MRTTMIKLFIALISWLPLAVARLLGKIMGEWVWRTNSRGTRTARINISRCFPQFSGEQCESLVRASMHDWGMTIMEVPIIWRKGPTAVEWVTSIKGQEKVEAALQKKKGLIIISPHLGNWELVGQWITTFGPTTILYQPPKLAGVNDIMRAGRSKAGVNLVPTNMRGIAGLIKALKRGEITGVLPDMEPAKNAGVFVPFFGVQALTMTLAHSLQQRSGAVVLLTICKRNKAGFEIHIVEPPSNIYADNERQSVTALNQAVEQVVMMSPEQYQWEYKRFKRRPEGEPKIYPKDGLL